MVKERRSEELLEDYSLESVPLERRKSWINLAVIASLFASWKDSSSF